MLVNGDLDPGEALVAFDASLAYCADRKHLIVVNAKPGSQPPVVFVAIYSDWAEDPASDGDILYFGSEPYVPTKAFALALEHVRRASSGL